MKGEDQIRPERGWRSRRAPRGSDRDRRSRVSTARTRALGESRRLDELAPATSARSFSTASPSDHAGVGCRRDRDRSPRTLRSRSPGGLLRRERVRSLRRRPREISSVTRRRGGILDQPVARRLRLDLAFERAATGAPRWSGSSAPRGPGGAAVGQRAREDPAKAQAEVGASARRPPAPRRRGPREHDAGDVTLRRSSAGSQLVRSVGSAARARSARVVGRGARAWNRRQRIHQRDRDLQLAGARAHRRAQPRACARRPRRTGCRRSAPPCAVRCAAPAAHVRAPELGGVEEPRQVVDRDARTPIDVVHRRGVRPFAGRRGAPVRAEHEQRENEHEPGGQARGSKDRLRRSPEPGMAEGATRTSETKRDAEPDGSVSREPRRPPGSSHRDGASRARARARSISRRASRSAIAWRLSCVFLPLRHAEQQLGVAARRSRA